MTKEELNEHIQYLEGSWFSGWATPMVIDWLKDIRDNGITEPKKYTVQVIKGDNRSFLNQLVNGESLFMDNSYQESDMRTQFTKPEIEEFKKRDDLAIDWAKAIIKPVEDK